MFSSTTSYTGKDDMDCISFSNFSGVYEVGVGLNLGFALVSDFVNIPKRRLNERISIVKQLVKYESDGTKSHRLKSDLSDAILLQTIAIEELSSLQRGANLALCIFASLCIMYLIFAGYSDYCEPNINIYISIVLALAPVPFISLMLFLVTTKKLKGSSDAVSRVREAIRSA